MGIPVGILDRLRTNRPFGFACGLGLALLVASSVWFFTARDDRGRTSRLTADAWYYHAYLPSLVHDGDLDFTNQYRITKNWYRLGQTDEGRPANVFGIGPAVFEMPLFLFGAEISRVTGGANDGFGTVEVKLSLYASLLYSLAALLFVGRVIRRRLGGPYLAAVVPVVLACAGPVVYYAIRQPGYAHPFATFWAAWLIDRWDASFDGGAEPRSLRCWLALGALLGLAALARPQLALWAVLMVPAVVDDLRRGGRASLRQQLPRWAAGAGLSLVCVLPQLLAWDAIYGELLLTPQGPGFMRWDDPAWSEVLFSSRNGLLPWAPLYAFAGLGMLVLAVRRPRLGLALIAGVALQTVANGAAWDWWAGGSFGGRRFDSCFAAFAVGLAALVIWPAPAGERPARRWSRRGAVALAMLLASLLAVGNLVWAAKVSAPTARIRGGQMASVVLDQAIDGRLGGFVASASRAANWPARALYARKHGTVWDAYDFIVGSHVLGELYPGLNSFKGKTRERLNLSGHRRKLIGARIDNRIVTTTEPTVKVLFGLNRTGAVQVTAHLTPPAAGTIVLRLNGHPIARADATPERAQSVSGTTAEIVRGTNVLSIDAPVGTTLPWIELEAAPQTK